MKTRRRKKARTPHVEYLDESFLGPLNSDINLDEADTVCPVCEAEFLDEDDLKIHIAQVHVNESIGKTKCILCCSVFTSDDDFVCHFIHEHIENITFCYYCYRLFTDNLTREHHELKHCPSPDNPLSCSQCSVLFTNRCRLQNHEYNEHKNSGEEFILHDFFPLLSSYLCMKIEIFIDSLCSKTPFSCVQCSHYSCNVNDYVTHLKKKKCKCFACNKCFNTYKKKSGIRRHIINHLECYNDASEVIKSKSKQCRDCGKQYEGRVREHKRSCKVTALFQCSTCEIVFPSVSELTDHQLTKHKVSVSLMKCKYCKKEFAAEIYLKKHLKRAHKDKSLYKYNCVYCDSVYIHPKKLFAHFFTTHKDIEPYCCTICSESFRLRKNFTVHIKLCHKSVGFVEFDERLHVYFKEKKSDNAYIPRASVDLDSSTEDSDDGSWQQTRKENKTTKNVTDQAEKEATAHENIIEDSNPLETESKKKVIPKEIKEVPIDPNASLKPRTLKITDITQKQRSTRYQNIIKPLCKKIRTNQTEDEVDVDDSSEDEPLSKFKEALIKTESEVSLRKRRYKKDKRSKVTCKICNKYCYTFQNYHHHMSLHENRKPKTCIKCRSQFATKEALKDHLATSHSGSKLVDTLKSLLEKRTIHPTQKPESFRSVLERRRKNLMVNEQNTVKKKFRATIKKVRIVDDCTATIRPMTDHGISVKNFIENFKPDNTISISNSVTIKTADAEVREPSIRMKALKTEAPLTSGLRYPVRFEDNLEDLKNSKVTVKLLEQLITKSQPINMTPSNSVPVLSKSEPDEEPEDYSNTFVDDNDYTQSDAIPEVAHEVLVGKTEEIPKPKRLAQEVIIPQIPEKYGEIKIAHLIPEAPYFKIVKMKNLLQNPSDNEPEVEDIKLPDKTKLVAVKNPYKHLIPTNHLQEIIKANTNKYYQPKKPSIATALVRAQKTHVRKQIRDRRKKKIEVSEE